MDKGACFKFFLKLLDTLYITTPLPPFDKGDVTTPLPPLLPLNKGGWGVVGDVKRKNNSIYVWSLP